MVYIFSRHLHKRRKRKTSAVFNHEAHVHLKRPMKTRGLRASVRGKRQRQSETACCYGNAISISFDFSKTPCSNPSTYRHLSQCKILSSFPWSNKPCSLLKRALLWFVCSAKVFLLLTFLPQGISTHPAMLLCASCLPSSFNLGNPVILHALHNLRLCCLNS